MSGSARLRLAVLTAAWCLGLAVAAAAQDPAPAGDDPKPAGDTPKPAATTPAPTAPAPAPESSETGGLTADDWELLWTGTVALADRREKDRRRSSAATMVVTAKEIRESGAQSLAEVLRYLPGLTVMRVSRSHAEVNIRGLNTPGNPELMLLIDGRPAPLEFFGITLWNHLPVAIEDIERIEIVRGAATPLYGANAFTGVINITTRKPADEPKAVAEVVAGSRDSVRATGRVSGRRGDWGITASVNYERGDGYSLRLDRLFLAAEDPIMLDREPQRVGIEDLRAGVAVLWTGIEHLEVKASGGLVRSTDIEVLASNTTWLAEHLTDGFGRLEAKVEHPKFGDVHFDVWLRRSHIPARTQFPTPTAPFLVDQTIVNDLFQVQGYRIVRPFAGNVLTYGGAWRVSWLNGRAAFGDAEMVTIGSLFIQDEYELHETLDVSLSLRWDSHTAAGDTVAPRAAIVWNPTEDHTLRLSGGQAFRNPTHVQNFASVMIPTGLPAPFPPLAPIVGNEELEAERLTMAQFDYTTRLIPGASFELNVFYGYLEDLILFTPPPATTPTNYRNAGSTDVAGGEAALEGKVTDWLSGFINYSFIWVDGEFEGLSPKHQGNVGLRATLPHNVRASVTVHAQSAARFVGPAIVPDREQDGYVLVRARIAYRYEQGELSLTAYGPFEAHHQEFPRGGEIPWHAAVALSYSF